MISSARQSGAARATRRRRLVPCLLASVLALAPIAGCGLFHSDFPVAVGNRMPNTVSVFANGQRIGDVGSNLTATFAIEESVSGSLTSPASPTPVAQVTFSARDMTTGVLSAGTTATVVKDVTTYVDVAPCIVIDGGSASPCVSVSSATSGSTTTGSPGQACTFSLSASSQSFNTTGGSATVTVSTSNGCAWSAASSASWVVVVSGSSGTGTGVVAYQVAPNTTGQPRTATLSIAGQTLTINQTA
ncbi:MAG TPA: BACON domain-containing carbohydrate-binding protein [Vicinamibacterales bacterium]|nr:BACON domain-containing carbohydrate-binding protein [Vicinamibacterales bacterium]